jgi:hypothetical protein
MKGMAAKVSIVNALLRARKPKQPPIVIVGNGRSGTSWVGKTLGQAPRVIYYREPCNPSATGVDDDTVWSRYVPAAGHDPYFEDYLEVAFNGLLSKSDRLPWKALLRRLCQSHRIIIKEVATFPSIEWLYLRWRPEVLMIVRHPCDCALSVRKAELDQFEQTRLQGLINNDYLRRNDLAPFLHHLMSVTTALEVSAAIWAIKNLLAIKASHNYPEWKLVRYEDLCTDPIGQFRSLYKSYGLSWSDRIENWIRITTEQEKPGHYSTSRVTSRQIDSWRGKLDEGEIKQIRRMVEPFNLPFYNKGSEW